MKKNMHWCERMWIGKRIIGIFKSSRSKDGYRYSCKECERIYYLKNVNQERQQERSHLRYLTNIKNQLLNKVHTRSKNKNIFCNLTIEDIIIPDSCPIFDIKLEISKNRASENSPSIDRIDNTKGYIKGNIVFISWRANRIKNSANIDEMKLIVDNYHIMNNQTDINHSLDYNRQYLLNKARERAKLKNIEITITKKDVIIPNICPILNIKIERGLKIKTDFSPTIDRIDLNYGYVPGNIRVISYRANTLKNNSTFKEYLTIYTYYKNILNEKFAD